MEVTKKLQKLSLAALIVSLLPLAALGVSENYPAGWCTHGLGGLQHRPRPGSQLLAVGA